MTDDSLRMWVELISHLKRWILIRGRLSNYPYSQDKTSRLPSTGFYNRIVPYSRNVITKAASNTGQNIITSTGCMYALMRIKWEVILAANSSISSLITIAVIDIVISVGEQMQQLNFKTEYH